MANIIERGNDCIERTGEVLGVDAYQGQQNQKNSQIGDDIKGRAALVDGINRFTFNDDGYRAFGGYHASEFLFDGFAKHHDTGDFQA